jgi:RNA polymerase sigma-70 factor (ECF subfamily)
VSNEQNKEEAHTSMKAATDADLLERSRSGDAAAFKQLVVRYQGRVAGVVQSMLGRTAEAEDVGQEVFIRFYQSIDKFKGDAALSTYLIRIAINLSLNEIRRRKRRNAVFGSEEEGRFAITSDDRSDTKEMVTYELKKLDPDFQSVVTLRLIEGYSTEETSEILGIPLGTVLSRLSRAQKKLKSILSKYMEA